MAQKHRSPAAYPKIILWLAANDDLSWLDAPYPKPPKTVELVIAGWGRSLVEVIRDLRHVTNRRPIHPDDETPGEAAATEIIGPALKAVKSR